MDEPIMAIAEEMEARYRDMINEICEAEIHNYATPQSMFDSELSTYFSDEPDAHYDVKVALEQHRDPFARISTTSNVIDKGKARADNNIVPAPKAATASCANSSTQTTARKDMFQPPPTDSKDQIRYPPSAYFCQTSKINPNTIDLNNVGILFEFADYFFVVFEIPRENNKHGVVPRSEFVRRSMIGRYLTTEWAMLEKCDIRLGLGHIGTGALGADAEKREWNAHGRKIQHMRTRCLETARELTTFLTKKEDFDLDRAPTEQIKRLMARALSRAVDMADAEWKVKEQEEIVDDDKLVEEFIVFEE